MTAVNSNFTLDQTNLAGGARLMLLGRVTPGLGLGVQMLDRVRFMLAGPRGSNGRTRLR